MKRFVGLVALLTLTMPASSASAGDGVYVYVNGTSCRSFDQDEYAMVRLGASLSPRVPPDAGTLIRTKVIWQHWQRHRSPATTGEWGPWEVGSPLIEIRPGAEISYPFEHRWATGDDADDRFRLGMVTRFVFEGAPGIRIAHGNLATYRGASEGCTQLPAGYRVKD